jgi:hypothetical protein
MTKYDRIKNLHRYVPARERLCSSKKALASIITLYEVRIPDDFEHNLRRPWRGPSVTCRQKRGRSFGLCLHSDIGLHISFVSDRLLEIPLEGFAIAD